ncbi:MAG: alanine--glyoxylate aminotransferase family protein, partial [Betaproteobacteria bacterium]|nr:alanine--glyoxylate aminotransferase family protein [Betaproteobacteria bacterium]
CLCALETVFADMGAGARFGAAEAAAYHAYALNPTHSRSKKVAAA